MVSRTNALRPFRRRRPGSLFWLPVLVAVFCTVWVPFALLKPSVAQDQERTGEAAKAGPPAPSARGSQVARVIAALMPQNHISRQGLDDKISKRAFDLYLESLDPMKLYFYQSDIEEFSAKAMRIDDMVRGGDLSFGYEIFERFVKRVDERVDVAMELLDAEFSFEKDETIVVDPDAARYARSPADARDRWRRQIKYALLDLKDNGTEGEEAIEKLRRRYRRYATRWKGTDSDDLLELYLTAVTMSYDPHSTYMSPSTLDDFEISMRLNLEGIGAALREKDGTTVVSNVIAGGAADQHGKLKPDDVIVSVGEGVEGPMVDIVEMPLRDVVKLIRGKAGTTVRLGVKSGGVGATKTYKIVRARVELEESAARGEVIEHSRPGSSGKVKVGYINLPSFYLDMDSAKQNKADYRSSTRDVRRILESFKDQGVEAVVLDLSKNGGGSLTEAISLTGLFIDRGPVVQVKDSGGSVQQYSDDVGGTAWDGPLVVMTSMFSASASEIFAGAIQDYERGIVVGDPSTHGKGTVQTLLDLGEQLFRNNRENYGALKVTLQQFYLPDGESTQRKGVPADIILPSISSEMDEIAEDDLEYALEHDTVAAAEHRSYGMSPPALIQQLRQSSAGRVEQDEEFVDLIRRIELYVQQKERDAVSLNEGRFMKRREDLNARKEEEEEELAQELNSDEVYEDSYYNREVLSIAQEYVEGLRQQNIARVD